MMSELRLALIASFLVLSACVSTTSGRAKSTPNNQDAADLNYQLGARYYRNGQYELARDRLNLALELNPKRAIAWSTLALTYEQLGNLRLAEESWHSAVRADPRNFEVQNNYAVFLCGRNKFDEARKQFEQAAKAPTNDDSEVTLTNAGVCMMQEPNYEQAEVFFREALEERANHPEALFQMSVLSYQTGDFLTSRAFLQRYLGVSPASADILYLGVQVEDQLGDERAEDDYRARLLTDFPDSAEARAVRQYD